MDLFKRDFERRNNDTIAVIYELLPNLGRKAIKPYGNYVKRYKLDDNKKYLIICGLSEFTYGMGSKIDKIYPITK